MAIAAPAAAAINRDCKGWACTYWAAWAVVWLRASRTCAALPRRISLPWAAASAAPACASYSERWICSLAALLSMSFCDVVVLGFCDVCTMETFLYLFGRGSEPTANGGAETIVVVSG